MAAEVVDRQVGVLDQGHRRVGDLAEVIPDEQGDRPEARSVAGDLWTVPYPQEINDIPQIIGRQREGNEFADMIIDDFDERLHQARAMPLVMGIALHPYLIGQPHRIKYRKVTR